MEGSLNYSGHLRFCWFLGTSKTLAYLTLDSLRAIRWSGLFTVLMLGEGEHLSVRVEVGVVPSFMSWSSVRRMV